MNGMSDYTRTGDASYLVGKTKNSIFCDFEDPDYAAFFKDSVEAVEAFEGGRMNSADAAKRIFDMANQYEFAVPIRKDALVRAHWMKEEDQLTERDLGFVRRGFRWALTTPLTRDVVSSSETFFRWCARFTVQVSTPQSRATTLMLVRPSRWIVKVDTRLRNCNR